MANYNTAYIRFFKCRKGRCRAVCNYNLQQISREHDFTCKCPKCGQEWLVEIDKNKRACCGKVMVKFTSVEKNVNIVPIVFNDRVHRA